jgi:hypothetical protein
MKRCKNYKSYKAKKEPTCGCDDCKALWQVAQRAEKASKSYEAGYRKTIGAKWEIGKAISEYSFVNPHETQKGLLDAFASFVYESRGVYHAQAFYGGALAVYRKLTEYQIKTLVTKRVTQNDINGLLELTEEHRTEKIRQIRDGECSPILNYRRRSKARPTGTAGATGRASSKEQTADVELEWPETLDEAQAADMISNLITAKIAELRVRYDLNLTVVLQDVVSRAGRMKP